MSAPRRAAEALPWPDAGRWEALTAVTGRLACVQAAADAAAAPASMCGVCGVRRAAAAVHAVVVGRRRARCNCVPARLLPRQTRDRRDSEPREALRRLRAGWGRPGGGARSRWGRVVHRRWRSGPEKVAGACPMVCPPCCNSWRFGRDHISGMWSRHEPNQCGIRFTTCKKGAECKKPRIRGV